MYHVSAQGVDERLKNVHYYYYDRQRMNAATENANADRVVKKSLKKNLKQRRLLAF